MAEQLSFDLPIRTARGRNAYFVSSANQNAVAQVESWPHWAAQKLILIGPQGSGKTHLAQIWATERGAIEITDLTTMDLPAEGGPVLVENICELAGRAAHETALFHLHNHITNTGGSLLLTCRAPVAQAGFQLPDLASRLGAIIPATIAPPDDALLGAVLLKLFTDRQISPQPNVVPYILTHMPRSFADAADIVAELDRIALRDKRAITRSLAAQVLNGYSGLPIRLIHTYIKPNPKGRDMTHPADFLNSDFPDAETISQDTPSKDLAGPGRFINRELSWLAFNWRVLEEAANPKVPLLERLRFLSISATNLDEFYSVRVAGLRELDRTGKNKRAADGLTPAQQLAKIDQNARALMQSQQNTLADLRIEMAKEGIEILTAGNIEPEDQDFLNTQFLDTVFPLLSPLAIDPAHPFPFIANDGFALALELERETDGNPLRALVPIPPQLGRFARLPDRGAIRFLPMEDALLLQMTRVFPGYVVKGHCAFSVLRNSDLEVEDEAEDLVREFETALKRRRRGDVIRLKITADAPPALRALIKNELSVANNEVVEIEGLLALSDLNELIGTSAKELLWPNFSPRVPERISDHDGDMFAAIRQKDMLLQHPYETFDMVVRFLRQAARDPNVVAIKQTLYRTSKKSPIVEALCEAAEDGKSVTALVELKARFDEAANIRQSRRLERAGAHVVYGFLDLKTHAKISTVVRREGEKLVTYTHYGTGNYHPITAQVYTDLSLFTCDAALGRDATKVFNYISGYAPPVGLENISISPLTLRQTLLTRINAEAENAKAGKPAGIWAKLNSVIDAEIIDALYAASQAGVKISLVVRGICGLKPGVKGLSENIRVKSIVGRFLEHSRIVCFANGHALPSDHARVYISSADWMGRNLNRRVETLVEMKNPTVKAQIVHQIMAANLADVDQSWIMGPDGEYDRMPAGADEFRFNCHRFFMENPSLSGRGSAGADDVPELTHTDVKTDLPKIAE